MGYRSDVCIALTRQGREALKQLLASLNRTEAKALRGFLSETDFHRVDTKSKAEVWLWRNTKWYEEPGAYPAIYQLAQLLRGLALEDYRFLRLGEYPDDVEDQGQFWNTPFDMHIVREIVVK